MASTVRAEHLAGSTSTLNDDIALIEPETASALYVATLLQIYPGTKIAEFAAKRLCAEQRAVLSSTFFAIRS
jgi:hypothetical protein